MDDQGDVARVVCGKLAEGTDDVVLGSEPATAARTWSGAGIAVIPTAETTQECEANKPTWEEGCGMAGMAGNLCSPSHLFLPRALVAL